MPFVLIVSPVITFSIDAKRKKRNMEASLRDVCNATNASAAAAVTTDGLCVRLVEVDRSKPSMLSQSESTAAALVARASLRMQDSDVITTFQPSRYVGVSSGPGEGVASSAGGGHRTYDMIKSSSMDSLQSSNLNGFSENSNLFALLVEEQYLGEFHAKTGFQSVVIETSERLVECRIVSGPSVPAADTQSPSNAAGSPSDLPAAASSSGKLLVAEVDVSLFLVTSSSIPSK